jgi:hypothetical protein
MVLLRGDSLKRRTQCSRRENCREKIPKTAGQTNKTIRSRGIIKSLAAIERALYKMSSRSIWSWSPAKVTSPYSRSPLYLIKTIRANRGGKGMNAPSSLWSKPRLRSSHKIKCQKKRDSESIARKDGWTMNWQPVTCRRHHTVNSMR